MDLLILNVLITQWRIQKFGTASLGCFEGVRIISSDLHKFAKFLLSVSLIDQRGT